MTDLATILRVYQGSDGEATKALYTRLGAFGPAGMVAVNLFRACKASERAKVYRGGGYRGMAYDKKDWSLGNLCKALAAWTVQPDYPMQLRWGWGIDARLQERGDPHHHVLYVDLPTGQVSFHTDRRGAGPDYPGSWDGMPRQSAERICRWCAQLFVSEIKETT
jgi:hypothetical protein